MNPFLIYAYLFQDWMVMELLKGAQNCSHAHSTRADKNTHTHKSNGNLGHRLIEWTEGTMRKVITAGTHGHSVVAMNDIRTFY